MKPYEDNYKLKDSFIQGWYVPEELADNILNEVKQFYIDKKMRLLDPPHNYFYSNFNNLSAKIQESFIINLNQIVLEYEKNYKDLDVLNYKLYNHLNVQYWEPGKHYSDWHFEIANGEEQIYRNLVFMTYLNDIELGGETEFSFQKCKIKPRKGLTVIWPANWTHRHKGVITQEEKYAITGWFELVPQRTSHHFNIPRKEKNIFNYG